VIGGLASYGVYDFVRASAKLKDMIDIRDKLKNDVETHAGRLDAAGEKLASLDADADDSDGPLAAAELSRALLRMAEASRYHQLR
jgi:hypothetical protein